MFFLIVVTVGGAGSLGAFVAALLLGFLDNAGKYLWPDGGAFFIYIATVALLLQAGWPVRTRTPALRPPAGARASVAARHRWRVFEALPWLLAAGAFAFPDYLFLGTQVLILILFALSLDLILGYAGIVTLGHAAYFGRRVCRRCCPRRPGTSR